MLNRTFLLFGAIAFALISSSLPGHADDASVAKKPAITIGVIASLTSFAAPYGKAVALGAELAVDELRKKGIEVRLVVEDDLSDSKNVVTLYHKLTQVDRVDAIVGGTWWLDSIAKLADTRGIPVMSCETLMENGTVPSSSRFIMQGDLRKWVSVFEPAVRDNKWTKGAAIRFISTFGATLADEMRVMFSRDDRRFVGEFEYSDVQAGGANTIALQLKRSHADVVYIDGQPSGVAIILRKMKEQGLNKIGILTNNLITEAVAQGLVQADQFPNLYYNTRADLDPSFVERFKAKFNESPKLQADLGYYSVLLLAKAFEGGEPIQRLRDGITVDGKEFQFDSAGVLHSARQEMKRLNP
jgi:branched-chain amino acid transport system substrate-binding protein